jgi:hypothetical protein
MTSQVSRADVLDALYLLGGKSKAHEVRKTMLAIDQYAATVADRMRQNEQLAEDSYTYLKPGDTDINKGMRRCASCGKVRNLSGFFAKDSKCEYGRKLRCVVCRPPAGWDEVGRTRQDRYLCQKCETRKPLSHFPEAKQARPKLTMWCLACKGQAKELPGISCYRFLAVGNLPL